jgi:hypothetical protein
VIVGARIDRLLLIFRQVFQQAAIDGVNAKFLLLSACLLDLQVPVPPACLLPRLAIKIANEENL